MDLFFVMFVTMPVPYCFNRYMIGVGIYGGFLLLMALKTLAACDEA